MDGLQLQLLSKWMLGLRIRPFAIYVPRCARKENSNFGDDARTIVQLISVQLTPIERRGPQLQVCMFWSQGSLVVRHLRLKFCISTDSVLAQTIYSNCNQIISFQFQPSKSSAAPRLIVFGNNAEWILMTSTTSLSDKNSIGKILYSQSLYIDDLYSKISLIAYHPCTYRTCKMKKVG